MFLGGFELVGLDVLKLLESLNQRARTVASLTDRRPDALGGKRTAVRACACATHGELIESL